MTDPSPPPSSPQAPPAASCPPRCRLPRPPRRFDALLPDPDLVRRLVERGGPYAPVQRYFASAAEYGALSGRKEAQQMFVAPVFRGDWAAEGRARLAGVEPILEHAGLRAGAAALFGEGAGAIVRPQLVYANLTWQLPFHQGGGHTDIPAFRGVDRSRYPVWLLSAMGHSGLFERERIRIATAVAWFYQGSDGGFEYWPEGASGPCHVHEGAIHNTAILGDNDLMYHRVRPTGAAGDGLLQGMTLDSRLVPDGGGRFRIVEGDRELAAFDWPRLRVSVSWKAYVLRDAEEARLVDEHLDDLDVGRVFERFYADLEERGVAFPRPADPVRDPELVRVLARTYVHEPVIAG